MPDENSPWPPGQSILRAAANGNRHALNQLNSMDWSPLLPKIWVRRDCTPEDILNAFKQDRVLDPTFWERWIKKNNPSPTDLEAWLKCRLRFFPGEEMRMEIRRELRRREALIHTGGPPSRSSFIKELTPSDVSLTLQIWREVVLRIETTVDAEVASPFLRVLDNLRTSRRSRKLHCDARVLDIILEIAAEIIQERNRRIRTDPPDSRKLQGIDLQSWLKCFSLCIRYQWIDWATGQLSTEYYRQSSLNLQDSTQQVLQTSELLVERLQSILNQSLSDQLPSEYRRHSAEEWNTLCGEKYPRIQTLLRRPEVSLESLQALKSWSKRKFESSTEQSEGVFTAVYYACLAAAIVHHNTLISSQSGYKVLKHLQSMAKKMERTATRNHAPLVEWLVEMYQRACEKINSGGFNK